MIQHLTKGKTLWEKLATWHQIVDRKASELLPQLETIVLDNNNSKDILALWSIEGLKSYNSSVVKKLIADKDSDIRREAIHSLASFEAPLDDIVKFLKPCISDSHCMVRSQVLRTLDEIKSANNQTIALLIQAIKPAAPDNKLGGNYESNFERFLVRKALERYPKELQVFLNSKKVKAYLKKSIEWSKLSLPSINYIE